MDRNGPGPNEIRTVSSLMVPFRQKCWVPGISAPPRVWGQGRQGDMGERRRFCSFQKPPGLWKEVPCSRVAQTCVTSLHHPRLMFSLFLLDPRSSLPPSFALSPPSHLSSPTRNGHPLLFERSEFQPPPDQGCVQGSTEAQHLEPLKPLRGG